MNERRITHNNNAHELCDRTSRRAAARGCCYSLGQATLQKRHAGAEVRQSVHPVGDLLAAEDLRFRATEDEVFVGVLFFQFFTITCVSELEK